MKLAIPSSADLVQAVVAVRDGVGDALQLLPRTVGLVRQAEDLIHRVGRVVDKIDTRIDRVDNLLSDVAATDQAARKVVGAVEATVRRAGALVELYDDSLRTLAPTVETFVKAIDPSEVAAMVGLVDRLPTLVKHLDEDVLPILTTLDRVAPDLHQLLEIAQDLQVALSGLPGMGWIRKRAEKEEEEAAREARAIENATGPTEGKPGGGRPS